MTRAKRSLGLVVIALCVGWATGHGSDGGVLFLAPAVLLVIPLLLGRYVGEKRMAALLRSLRRARAVRAPRCLGAARPTATVYRAGELIARSLAVRPPPRLTA